MALDSRHLPGAWNLEMAPTFWGNVWTLPDGGIEVTGRRGRRRNKLLDDLKERRGYSHLKEEALDQCFSTSVRPRPGKFFFHKTRARSQHIYS